MGLAPFPVWRDTSATWIEHKQNSLDTKDHVPPKRHKESLLWFLMVDSQVKASAGVGLSNQGSVETYPDGFPDCKLALKKSGHWTRVSLVLITANVPHGSWSEEQRDSVSLGDINSFSS